MRIEDYAKVLAARYEALEPEEKEAIRVLNQGPLLKKVFGPEIEPLTKRLAKPSARGFAEGGVVYDPAAGKMKKPDFLGGDGSEEYRTFKNDAGMIMTIRFIDGKPTAYIPPGYTEVTGDAAAEAKTPTPTTKASDKAKPKEGDREGGEPNQFSRDLSEVSTEDLQDQLDGLKSGKGFNAALTGFISKSPFGMVVQALTGKSIVDKAIEDLQNEIDSRNAPTTVAQTATAKAVENAVKGKVTEQQTFPENLAYPTGITVSKLGPTFLDPIRDALDAVEANVSGPSSTGPGVSMSVGTGDFGRGTTSVAPPGYGLSSSAVGNIASNVAGGRATAPSFGLAGTGGRSVDSIGLGHSGLGSSTVGEGRGFDMGDVYGGGPDGGGVSGGGSTSGGGGSDSGQAGGGGAGGYGGGGSSGGDVGTGSDNDGDGFGDMGGISGGWSKGGLVKKPARKRKK